MSFKFNPGLDSRLEELRNKRQEIENRLHERQDHNVKSNEAIQKDIELLTTKKDEHDRRNDIFLSEKKKTLDSFKNEMGKVQQADWIHQEERKKVNSIIEKNYPRYVQEVKQKIFRDQQEMDNKIKELKQTSISVAKMNEEIKKLSDELHYKRLELIEEEERKLRTDNILRKYLFAIPNLSPEGGYGSTKTEKHFLSDTKSPEESKRVGEFKTIDTSKEEFNYGNSEFNTALSQIKEQLQHSRQYTAETPAFSSKKDDFKIDQPNFSNAMSTIKKTQSQAQQPASNLTSTLKGGEAIDRTTSVYVADRPAGQSKNELKDSKSLGQSKGNGGTSQAMGSSLNKGSAAGKDNMGGSFGAGGYAAVKNSNMSASTQQPKQSRPITVHQDEIEDIGDI